MSSVYKPPKGKGTLTGGAITGIAISVLLFLAIPLTQIFTKYQKAPEAIEALEVAPPPPPPPPDEPPPPPEPEEQEPPPELDTPPPPISLEQLDMALNPGTGSSLAGDFALPTFNTRQEDLGGLEIFDLNDVDSAPQPKSKISFSYPAAAKRKGITGVVRIEYVVDASGKVHSIHVKESPSEILSREVKDVIGHARFTPANIGGRPVSVRMYANIPF